MAFAGADWPIPLPLITLTGELIRLESLNSDHEAELAAISGTEEIWRYLSHYGGTPDALHIYLCQAIADYNAGLAHPFVVRSRSDQRVVGLTRLKELSRPHRKGVVGSWYVPAVWGTGVNTEAKFLLLGYAFDQLKCVRIELHADSRNVRSREALGRMGAVEEGILRVHQIRRDGSRRDTVMFSVLDQEWPAVREKLLLRLKRQSLRVIANAQEGQAQ